jgi:ABC-type transporter Mla maintaining outer membrane lipid asymmetry ATPase subunit MlaF
MNLLEQFNQLKQRRDILLEQNQKRCAIIESELKKVENYTAARFVLAEVSRQTQEHLKERIEKLVTLCLQSVFIDRNIEFKLNFQIKRNKMECELLVLENGHELDLNDDVGGSAKDIISFALRIVLWGLETPRSRNLIILDEPFKQCGKLITKACQMVKEISKMLGVQIIMVTHSDELIDIAEKSWHVEYVNGMSVVTEDK